MAFETEKPDLTPEEEPVTSRDEAGEPSGEEDPANEEERIVDEPEDYLPLAQRIQADFENYRKRAVREAVAADGRRVPSRAATSRPRCTCRSTRRWRAPRFRSRCRSRRRVRRVTARARGRAPSPRSARAA